MSIKSRSRPGVGGSHTPKTTRTSLYLGLEAKVRPSVCGTSRPNNEATFLCRDWWSGPFATEVSPILPSLNGFSSYRIWIWWLLLLRSWVWHTHHFSVCKRRGRLSTVFFNGIWRLRMFRVFSTYTREGTSMTVRVWDPWESLSFDGPLRRPLSGPLKLGLLSPIILSTSLVNFILTVESNKAPFPSTPSVFCHCPGTPFSGSTKRFLRFLKMLLYRSVTLSL